MHLKTGTIRLLRVLRCNFYLLPPVSPVALSLRHTMLNSLSPETTHATLPLYGLQNTSDDLIVNMVMGTMFVVLPAFWLGGLMWAGVRVGGAVASMVSTGLGDIKGAGGKVGSVLFKRP